MQRNINNRILILSRPSLLSGVITSLLTVYLIVITIWTSVSDSAFIKQSIELFSQRTLEVGSANGTSAVFSDIFASSLVNELFYIGAWALVGVLTYLGITVVAIGLKPLSDIINIHHQEKNHRRDMFLEISAKLAFRVFMGAVILFYTIILSQILIPVSISAVKFLSSMNIISSLFSILQAVFILSVGFHLFVVLLRLFAMRIRIFGGADYFD